MSTKSTVLGLQGAMLLGSIAVMTGCVDPGSPLVQQSSKGCDEFQAGAPVSSDLKVDSTVKVFMQASADFSGQADAIRESVFTACANIAKDLGASDTWSSIDDTQAQISNKNGSGACDAAAHKVEGILANASQAQANVAISISRGVCHMSFDEQTQCDKQCSTDANCDPGTVQTRCDPASLSVMCSSACAANAECEGHADLPANCMGMCEAECEGECKGDCTTADGKRTHDDPNCHGKCSSSCNGTCRGMCKIDAPEGVQCGANVRCLGGCTASFTDPECVTEFTPPKCKLVQECHDSCSTNVVTHAKCDPPTVDVFANVEVSADVKPLIATLKANLPPLITAADLHGKLMLDAGQQLASSGQTLSGRVGDLDGKSLACAAKASTTAASAVANVNVSVQASAQVHATLSSNAE